MNNFVLFILGVILGVLITYSAVSRVPIHNENQPEKVQQDLDVPSNSLLLKPLPSTIVSPSQPTISTPISVPADLNRGDGNKPKLHSLVADIKWTPGKDGALDRLQSKVGDISAEFADLKAGVTTAGPHIIDVNSEATTKKDRHGHGRGISKGARGGGGRNIGKGGMKLLNPSDYENATVQYFVYHLKTGDRLAVNSKDVPASSDGAVYLPYPPLQKYHSQAQTVAQETPPFIPTLHSASMVRVHPLVVSNEKKRPLPNMTLQRAVFEPANLKLHLCNGVFEAYSASYLTTKEHILAGLVWFMICLTFCTLKYCRLFCQM